MIETNIFPDRDFPILCKISAGFDTLLWGEKNKDKNVRPSYGPEQALQRTQWVKSHRSSDKSFHPRFKTDLTPPQLKTILKGHYKEDNTSDLYQKRINICQEAKESAQDFLLSAIKLKDSCLQPRERRQRQSGQKEVAEVSWECAAQCQ